MGQPDAWAPSTWVATYAAIVGTAALFLEFRRWIESGPRLYISMMVEPLVIVPGVGVQEKLALSVYVDNRGAASTTLTNLCLFKFPTVFHKLLNRPTETFVVINPQPTGNPPNLPSELAPGHRWSGHVRPRPDVLDIPSKGLYVAVYATHQDHPYLKRVPQKQKLPKNAKEVTA